VPVEEASLLSSACLAVRPVIGVRGLVHDLVRVHGGLCEAFREVRLHALGHGHYALAMDDWLDFVNNIHLDSLLDDGIPLIYPSHGWSGGLLYVLLNVVDDVVVHTPVEDGLHLHYSVISDALLDDWSPHNCALHDGIRLYSADPVIVRTRAHGVVPSRGGETRIVVTS